MKGSQGKSLKQKPTRPIWSGQFFSRGSLSPGDSGFVSVWQCKLTLAFGLLVPYLKSIYVSPRIFMWKLAYTGMPKLKFIEEQTVLHYKCSMEPNTEESKGTRTWCVKGSKDRSDREATSGGRGAVVPRSFTVDGSSFSLQKQQKDATLPTPWL